MPDARLGQGAARVRVPGRATARPGELARFLAEQGMAKPYWPERLELVADMPRTPSGKIQKFKLREMAAKFEV
jgi:cyclohexanecarboxylate-CoA ligase